MSAVYFVQEGDRGTAVWRASDEAPDAFVAAVALDVYDSESEVRDRFAALVEVVAAHYRRAHVVGTGKPASRLAGLPCETCEASEADDVRHRAGQVADIAELGLSPSGLPIGCCKVRTAAVVGGRPSTSRSAAR